MGDMQSAERERDRDREQERERERERELGAVLRKDADAQGEKVGEQSVGSGCVAVEDERGGGSSYRRGVGFSPGKDGDFHQGVRGSASPDLNRARGSPRASISGIGEKP